jgi:hypothetical protein
MTNSNKIACKAAWPDLFSNDPTVAHMAASPMAVDFARAEKSALVKTILDAIARENLSEAAQKLRKEYRPSMNSEVLHLWAQDVVSVIDSIAVGHPPTPTVAAETNSYVTLLRGDVAEEAWLAFDFGRDPCSSDGWEYVTPGNEWTKKVYFEPDDPDQPSLSGSFTVRFKPETAEISEQFAMCNGQLIENPR